MTYTASDFQIGDIVRPAGDNHIDYFKKYLAGDIKYQVVKIDPLDNLVTLQWRTSWGEFFKDSVFAYRIESTTPDAKYSRVIRKIKQMEQKRKDLGYRW